MVLSSYLGLQWRWAHTKWLLQTCQIFPGLHPNTRSRCLPLKGFQRFLTHMQSMCFLCQVNNSVFSTWQISTLPKITSSLWHTVHKLQPYHAVYQKQRGLFPFLFLWPELATKPELVFGLLVKEEVKSKISKWYHPYVYKINTFPICRGAAAP